MSDNYSYVAEDEMLFSASPKSEPETCLGMFFDSAEDRREYFRNELRKKLKDPEFRAIEGFPIGEDEDIIALSDPPYYCACPNPWIPDFIREWEAQKTPTTTPYKREPFAADVKEDKGSKLYNIHAYHTKVPPRAIMRYILHYTEPGDIVLDGFCGSGMTGIASQMCSNEEEIKALGYSIKDDKITDSDGEYVGMIGLRKSVQGDLSPLATFISSNHCTKTDVSVFESKAKTILSRLHKEYDWIYETKDKNGAKGYINYTVWSDIVCCPECGEEIVVYDSCLNKNGQVLKDFICPHCHFKSPKSSFERKYVNLFDDRVGHVIEKKKQKPVLISYSQGKKRFEKHPNEFDLTLNEKIEKSKIENWYPIDKMLGKGSQWGDSWRAGYHHGIEYVHQFYSKRNRIILSKAYDLCKNDPLLLFWFSSIYSRTHILNRYMPNHHRHVGPMAGTLYVPYFEAEINIINLLEEKIDAICALSVLCDRSIISTSSCSDLLIPNDSIDYVFLDPPFGANLNYSELSFILECWLRIVTNNKEEAIENESQQKGIFEYRTLMTKCFGEVFRVLKPGHWMTVEFSNTDSAVWNSIQNSLSEVGFVVASVNSLDKGRGGMQAIIGPVAVKQDLILSLYKPDESFEQQITTAVGTEAVWTFVRKHLEYLPLVKRQGDSSITVPERDPRIIYDRMVSYFVGHNMLLPISSPDFLSEMPRRFVERTGLYYLPEQAQQYDKLVARQIIETANMETSLFVCDENSAIAWIRTQLKEKPMTLGELTPLFMQELSSWTKGERKPELRELLEQNFLCYNGIEDVPSQVHSYLSTNFKDLRSLSKDNPALREKGKGRWYIPDPNKAGDLEKIREKALLKEFSIYESGKGKIKEFRIEAIRAGFKKAWQDKNYALIKNICERMPSAVVEEDEKLLMWYSGALNRLGE